MGQILDRLNGKEWKRKQVKLITDRVYDRVSNQSGRLTLTFDDLYIAVLLVFNDINKHLPGPHFDPPSKDHVLDIMKECDINLDGGLDREEFAKFIKKLTAETFVVISQGLLLTLVVAPTLAMATKRATEGVPHVGKVVQKVPNAVFASLVTLAVVWIQQSQHEAL
ncbi:unnamed protein product [Linum trigynum]|uniref:EF-hand domain-containing protein n=1 Tax=Linum trigynum TaxID=586398 RepID=A0AAV2E8U3_9ROSI